MKGEGAAGWHGKLPGASDFASRRLDARLVALWDEWISAGLARMRVDDEQGWVASYLASPIWRFVATGFFPAPFHGGAWTGVLMPSVDRVGRYYPLLLTSPLSELPRSGDDQARLWSWLARLEDKAFDALDQDWSIEALETALFELGAPLRGDGVLPPAHSGEAMPSAGMRRFFESAAPGSCVWYSDALDASDALWRTTRRDEEIGRLWQA
jgi:type VI secretion system protein ImpM